MPAAQNNARRLRLLLELLAERPEGLYKTSGPDGLYPAVFERIPLEGTETDIGADGKSRGEVNLTWSTVDLVKADWLEKSGTGLWKITDDGKQALLDFPDAAELAAEARSRYIAWSAASTEQKQEQLRTTISPVDKDEETIREAALLFVERGLQGSGSVFAPGRQVWARGPVDELREVFVDAPDPDAGDFVGKLKLQLSDVSDDARLLMSELVCWQLLPISPSRIGERAKTELIQSLLGYMDHPVQIPAEIAKAFKAGSFDPGLAMLRKRYQAVSMIIGLLEVWLEKAESEREALLGGAWAWRQFVNDLPGQRFPTQRNALIYLVHPQHITSIVSPDHKARIRNAFSGEMTEPSGDIDRDLLAIVLTLQQKTGAPVNFYADPYEKAWRNSDPGPVADLDDTADTEEVAAMGQRHPFRAADAALAEAVFMDQAWLQDQLDLLERRRQIILYGPPGTGKTYVALKLAEHVAGDNKYTEIVQFHPSYSYEDFFQGYRPVTSETGSLTYELKDGPLRRIVDQALKNPEFNYVLVIDEINRGNLAKIFGELYFLLEYRDKPIKLQYSRNDEDFFTLPSNLFLIGTMNTSDRSIALLDAAMRRRFSFIELHPLKHPVKTVLAQWLDRQDLSPEPAELLDLLNSKIIDPDFHIGPSYLMSPDTASGGLEDIWEHEILPLLAEYHYGEGLDVQATYGLQTLRAEHVNRDPNLPAANEPADRN